MGGTIQIAKVKNGETQIVEAHTFELKHIHDLDFLNETGVGDAACAFDSIFKTRHHESLSPGGYGLVVIDFDHKWVGAAQEYTSIGSFLGCVIHAQNFIHFKNQSTKKSKVKPLPDSELYFLEKMWDAGYLKQGIWDDGKNVPSLFSQRSIDTFDRLIEACNYDNPSPFGELGSILIEHPEWTFQNFNENLEGWLEFGKTLIDRGFEMGGEIQHWVEFLESEFEDQENPEMAQSLFLEEFVGHLRKKLSETLPKASLVKTKHVL